MKTTIACLSLALLTTSAAVSAAEMPNSRLEISPATQTVDEFAGEWRRARLLMRACGAPEEAIRPISLSEGMLVTAKAAQTPGKGFKVAADVRDFSGKAEQLEASKAMCAHVGRQLRPILHAVLNVMQCRAQATDGTPSCTLPLYRAPRF